MRKPVELGKWGRLGRESLWNKQRKDSPDRFLLLGEGEEGEVGGIHTTSRQHGVKAARDHR